MSFPSLEDAFKRALAAREKAHAPYSNYRVGAAVKLRGLDPIFTGCNVENASLGGSICAERVAILKAVSENPGAKIDAILIVTQNTDGAAPPCGLCLQTLNEFADQHTEIILANLKGVQSVEKFDDFLPRRFDSSKLKN